ncbi:TNF receptor-associated factor 6-like isoform X2 [Gigantopelta aegis]|uniref:TNF receptor-associated factor 6-like isoform X2 n=1 Tax=Gigantopelta aegis TaxID=1735272 RepID=UPI001B88C6C4|nr:TNF receptor-associated factor 6-like isoform X2 [Gigantopelta aegis]
MVRLSVAIMAEQGSQDGSLGRAVFPSMGDSCSSGEEYVYQERAEGFDYEFVPMPDSKYECAICLLILRDPQQTKCGHRFCQHCIIKWFRESERRCPVDNEPLEETDLFPDNFAKREILNFKLRCPNNKQGCDVLVVLRDIQSHLNQCPFAFIPCPNRCADILLRRDLPNHVQFKCVRRHVECPNCLQTITADGIENHQVNCPMVKMTCRHCGVTLQRHQMSPHYDECPKVIVNCDFSYLGCPAQVERCSKDQHLDAATQTHMQMLCNGVVTILRKLGINQLPTEVQQPSTGHMMPTEISSSLSFMSGALQSLNQQDPQLFNPLNTAAAVQGGANISSVQMFNPPSAGVAQGSGNISPIQSVGVTTHSSLVSSIRKEDVQMTQELSFLKHHSEGDREDENKGEVSLVGPPPYRPFSSLNLDMLSKQQTSLMKHEKSLTELQEGKKVLENVNKELSWKVQRLENTLRDVEGRSCNGNYFWRIKNYYRLRKEAEEGESTALHSPSFYSSFFGYKLCIRVNLNGVDSARGSYLSVFIHFMQGEFDDMLDWPFSGRIILSVVDQNTPCEVRNHVSETLIAKPQLAAFQRPVTTRNHKGFGYMEFLPLALMDNSSFVRNDTLIIRAQVIPSG